MKNLILTLACLATLTAAGQAADTPPKEDNTAKNVRDRDPNARTPLDQSNDPADLKITQQIRKTIMADKSLTMTAKNVKIITAGGQVTLRGPVTTEDEKTKITAAATAAAGAEKVVNQLEVKH